MAVSGALARVAIVLVLAICLVPPPAWAVRVNDLYAAEATIEDADELTREERFVAALDQVLIKVTGRRDVVDDPDFGPIRERAAALVLQWRPTPEGVWAAFDGTALVRLLSELRLPEWGVERPLTIAWLVADTAAGEREILSASPPDMPQQTLVGTGIDPSDVARRTLLETARDRGLPVVLPLADTEDLTLVTPQDVCGGFEDPVEEASRRYGAQAVLLGCARNDFSGTQVSWTLLAAGERTTWRGGLAEGIEGTADRLAQAFSASAAVTAAVRWSIEGIASFADYARVMAYLEELSLLERIVVAGVEAGTLRLEIEARGAPEQAAQAVVLGGVLSRLPADPGEPGLQRFTAAR